MTTNDIKEFRAACKKAEACAGEYRRLISAGNHLDKVMRVIRDNASWIVRRLPDGPWRTPEVCLAAVRQNGWAVEYLTDAQRTPEVCLEAVRQWRWSVKYLTEVQRTAMKEYRKRINHNEQ